jgi:NTP pyrophosphatase (non-canonical NTP hydrolase)
MSVRRLQEEAHRIAVEHGWWEEPRSAGEALMLVVTELAEAMEALRDEARSSEAIPAFSKVEEELADAVIRILDFAGGLDLDLEGALEAKMRFNESRPYRHGGKRV